MRHSAGDQWYALEDLYVEEVVDALVATSESLLLVYERQDVLIEK